MVLPANMLTFSSFVALKVVIMETYSATVGEIAGFMVALSFQ